MVVLGRVSGTKSEYVGKQTLGIFTKKRANHTILAHRLEYSSVKYSGEISSKIPRLLTWLGQLE